jgi:choline dehydrogenase
MELGRCLSLLQEGKEVEIESSDDADKLLKSVTFTEPLAEYVDNYNYTWDVAVYGGSAPIYSCLPPFLWADHSVMRDAWQEMGIIVRKECAGGDKDGLCWVPTSEHPETSRRSHAGLGHYAEIMPRSNYHLLVKHQVTRIIYPRGIQSGPPIVEIRSLDDGQHANITAKAEVIIAAGTFQTPAILQRSGIGAISSLKAADIPVFHELPGVGANLQDHSGPALEWKYTKPGNFSPLPADMRDPAFAADAAAGFNETPARGPYTLAMGNSAIYMSLPNITANYANIVNGIRNMSGDGSTHSHLPIDYDNNPTLIAGYNRQLSVLADFYANPKAPSMEVPWATGTSFRAIMLHPLSRGTVRLNNTDHLAQPILDYRTASNPIDLDIHLAHLRYLRSTFDTPTMRRYGAVETDPGVAKQDAGSLRIHIKDGMTFSFLHPCCTAAMLPKELGGVVGPDLKVHGLKGLRVVDISVLPFLVSSHTSSTAYALGEKVSQPAQSFACHLTFSRLRISLSTAGVVELTLSRFRAIADDLNAIRSTLCPHRT